MAREDELDAIAWRDPRTDRILVRVRGYIRLSNGKIGKRGVVIALTDEKFARVAEGMEYPQTGAVEYIKSEREVKKIKTANPDAIRWTSVSEEVIDESK